MVLTTFVSFADQENFIRQQNNLAKSVQTRGYDIQTFRDLAEIGSPSHAESPYAFKYYSILAARARGYDIVIWCDSIVTMLKPIRPWIDEIRKVGVYLQHDESWSCGMWSNDKALEFFGVSRDDAMKIPSVYACVMAFDFRHPATDRFLSRWKECMDVGLFRGNYTNTEQTESQDPRCRGHRHDQTCAELIAHEQNIPLSPMVLNVYMHTPKYGIPYVPNPSS